LRDAKDAEKDRMALASIKKASHPFGYFAINAVSPRSLRLCFEKLAGFRLKNPAGMTHMGSLTVSWFRVSRRDMKCCGERVFLLRPEERMKARAGGPGFPGNFDEGQYEEN
jgi:hypothetical protein